jgi:hypothetical protein
MLMGCSACLVGSCKDSAAIDSGPSHAVVFVRLAVVLEVEKSSLKEAWQR